MMIKKVVTKKDCAYEENQKKPINGEIQMTARSETYSQAYSGPAALLMSNETTIKKQQAYQGNTIPSL